MKKNRQLSPSRIIPLSFFAMILLGTLLLMGALCETQLRRAGRQLRYA